MKTIQVLATIDSLRSKVDKSLGLSVSTPELSSEEKAAFMDIQGLNVELTIKPIDEPSELLEVKSELPKQKKPHVRLQNVLFVYWDQNKKDIYPNFEDFYKVKMNEWIESIKEKLHEG